MEILVQEVTTSSLSLQEILVVSIGGLVAAEFSGQSWEIHSLCVCSVTQSCPDLCNPMDRLFCPWNFLGKNTGLGCHFLLHRIFPIQGSNPCFLHLLHRQADSLPLSHLGIPIHSLGKPLKKASFRSPIRNQKSTGSYYLDRSLKEHLLKEVLCELLDSSVGRESTCNAGDLGSIPGLGRSPGKGIDYPLQYSGLENSVDCIIHGVAKSCT